MTTDTRPKTEAEKLFKDLSKPDLANLAYVLRHPDTWPKGFIWNFGRCDQCAMGLAHLLWKELGENTWRQNQALSQVARAFAMPYEKAEHVFIGERWVPQKKKILQQASLFREEKSEMVSDFERVTPEMVARQIDKFLAEQK